MHKLKIEMGSYLHVDVNVKESVKHDVVHVGAPFLNMVSLYCIIQHYKQFEYSKLSDYCMIC